MILKNSSIPGYWTIYCWFPMLMQESHNEKVLLPSFQDQPLHRCVSYRVKHEYALQKQGYVNAFNSAAIQTLITATPNGIAVSYLEWAGDHNQSVKVNWTHLTNEACAANFATAIGSTSRDLVGSTAPGSAIYWATTLFSNNGYEGTRNVIDVSGDGEKNDGMDTASARDTAVNAGFTINGLAIETTEFPNLSNWYILNIMGGTGAFVIAANSFASFKASVSTKLFKEIGGEIPEPATMILFGLGLLGFTGISRRKK